MALIIRKLPFLTFMITLIFRSNCKNLAKQIQFVPRKNPGYGIEGPTYPLGLWTGLTYRKIFINLQGKLSPS